MRRWILLGLSAGALAVAAIAGCAARTSERPVTSRFEAGDPVPRVEIRAADGQPVRWVEVGPPEAPAAVLFVHGSPGGWDAWQTWLRMADLGRETLLLAPDRPGYGGSGRGDAVPSLEAQAAALLERLDGLPATTPVLAFGHSLGGAVVARLAADRPERFDRIVLLAPSVAPEHEELRWYNRLAATPPVRWILPRSLRTSNEEILPLREELEDLAAVWDRIEAEIVVFHGLDDRLVPAAHADWIERRSPSERTRIERFAGEGHFLLWQRPELVGNEIRDWRSSVALPSPESRGASS